MILHFDFTKQATRAHILETVLAACNAEQLAKYETLLTGALVPDYHHHDFGEVCATIDALEVPAEVKESMRGVYTILAKAEAQVHGCKVEETHFHEVGNASGIKNALSICVAIYALAPERITATRVQPGCGQVACAHGLMDIPAPATAAILSQGIPVLPEEDRIEGELCTPTSAAVIAYFVQEFQE